jgi:hypothetical protein
MHVFRLTLFAMLLTAAAVVPLVSSKAQTMSGENPNPYTMRDGGPMPTCNPCGCHCTAKEADVFQTWSDGTEPFPKKPK